LIPLRLTTDERLARLATEGNDAAFAALHRRYDALLHGYARSIARDADDAADALQNTWIAALIALRADRRRAPVRPWLFRIAHNAAIDVLRRKSAAIRPIERGFLAVVPSVDEEYARTETMAEMVGDMRELPTNQRAALVMRELADLDYSEIAIALSTSEGNARQLVFAARDGLRESRAGRALPCGSVRGVLARADGRELRRRRLRAHLDSCQDCRTYAETVRRPTSKVASWAPTPAVLQSIYAAAGGSGVAVTQGGSFGVLAKGAVAAALVVAGVGTGEVVVHHGGDNRTETSAPDARLTARAAGAIAADAKPGARAAAPPAVPEKAVAVPSTRTTRTTVLASASVTAVADTSASKRSEDRTSQGSRREPGSSEPADWSPSPHAGDRDAGADLAGRGGNDGSDRRGGGRGGAREARSGFGDDAGARGCDPQAADSSAPASSRRERIPSLR
jgi:RNA polymerase sigma factor (sigma-70 family)